MNDALLLSIARWIHIASSVTLLGGMIFAVAAALPALRRAGSDGQILADAISARFRPWFLTAIAGLLLSGFYTYLSRQGMRAAYHMIFGMKFLLALHVFVVGYLALRPQNAKRSRQIAGVVASGLVILGLSAAMRYLALSVLVPR